MLRPSAAAPDAVGIAYTMALHGIPKAVIMRFVRSKATDPHVYRAASLMRGLQRVARYKMRVVDGLRRRPNLLRQYADNTVRDMSPGSAVIQPNFDSSPFGHPQHAG